jgi:hypothetical protein
MELGRALQTHRTARPGSRTKFVHVFKISMSATMFFSSEASYENDRLVF